MASIWEAYTSFWQPVITFAGAEKEIGTKSNLAQILIDSFIPFCVTPFVSLWEDKKLSALSFTNFDIPKCWVRSGSYINR